MMDVRLLQLAFVSAHTRRNASPMSTSEIKAFFMRRGLSLSAVALSIGEDRTAVSRVVNYERPGPRIRKLLVRKYRGLRFEKFVKTSSQRNAA